MSVKRLRWYWKTALFLALLLISLTCLGACYQFIGNWRDGRRFPQQGRSVQAGAVKLNLNCSGAGSPTVILETGHGMSSIGWFNIQPEIAKFTRVCSYDRAGYGWSEAGPEPRTALQVAKELKLLLDAAGEKVPYILVGASLGGIYARVYAGLYPSDIAGAVLVDATHDDIQNRLDTVLPAAAIKQRKEYEAAARRHGKRDRLLALLEVNLGLERLKAAFDKDPGPFGLSKDYLEETRYLEQPSKFRNATASEMEAFPESGAEARSIGNFGDQPLIVLTAGGVNASNPLLTATDRDRIKNLWVHVLQVEEAHLSTRGKQIIIEDSGHVIQFERPDAVISAVREVWGKTTSQSAKSSPKRD